MQVLLAAAFVALIAIVWRDLAGEAPVLRHAVSSGARMGPLEEGSNRQGRDISQSGIRTDDPMQCAAQCAANPTCKAMSFAKAEDGRSGVCFLKSDVPAATPNPAVTSAVKVDPAGSPGQ